MDADTEAQTLCIFGASGRSGKPLTEQALAAGYHVKGFVRDSAKLGLSHKNLEVIQGDVKSIDDVRRAVAGSSTVLSTIGHTKTSTKDVQTVATSNIVQAMQENGVRRFISLTGAGVKDSNDQPKFVDRVFGFLLSTFARDVIKDAERQAELIRASGLDYTIVRGPRLTDGPHTGSYRVGYVGKDSGTQVSRADIADFMLKQVKDDSWLSKAPVVSY